MNVLLLNAGAKDYGATQEILLTVQREISNGHRTETICLGNVDIHFCKGCKLCYNTCECVQKDDVDGIIHAIDAADSIVIAAPSYWADIPGQFKVFIDRCTPYSDTNPNPNHRVLESGKKCYAIALRTGARPFECEHILESIGHWCGHMKISMADSLYFCGINGKEAIEQYKERIRGKAKEWFPCAEG